MAKKITVNCTSCASRILVPELKAGKNIRCPKCSTVLSVPTQTILAPGKSEPESVERKAANNSNSCPTDASGESNWGMDDFIGPEWASDDYAETPSKLPPVRKKNVGKPAAESKAPDSPAEQTIPEIAPIASNANGMLSKSIMPFIFMLMCIWLLLLTYKTFLGSRIAGTASPAQEKELSELRNRLVTLNESTTPSGAAEEELSELRKQLTTIEEDLKTLSSRLDNNGSVESLKGDIELFRTQTLAVVEGRGKLLETQKSVLDRLDAHSRELEHGGKTRQLLGRMIMDLRSAVAVVVLALDGKIDRTSGMKALEFFKKMDQDSEEFTKESIATP